MDTVTDHSSQIPTEQKSPDSAPFFVAGKLIEGPDQIHRSRDLGVDFATPKLDLNSLVPPRTELPPLLNVPLAEIIEFLCEAGKRLADDGNPYLGPCIDRLAKVSLQPSYNFV